MTTETGKKGGLVVLSIEALMSMIGDIESTVGIQLQEAKQVGENDYTTEGQSSWNISSRIVPEGEDIQFPGFSSLYLTLLLVFPEETRETIRIKQEALVEILNQVDETTSTSRMKALMNEAAAIGNKHTEELTILFKRFLELPGAKTVLFLMGHQDEIQESYAKRDLSLTGFILGDM